ncbi:hypothetical protein ASU31_09585 [Pedobacter ginsenosidimutans]|uniref:Tail specific protease domain-containing protein n=1 Tax=Pedobacter ginsenosidimutans TaxID=687842 RepID=A0A0T5VRE6_9SPHI|nr:S41 family peptidase [Pedobacter ginsenosidimutans]KRT16408.1 hypothetical protein ASU31_09585 [Pedobacter ginsenosidimutans]
MKNIILSVLLFFSFNNLWAQNCNCSDNFRYLTNRITKNYVGFKDKITIKNQQQFQKFTDSLQKVADRSNAYKCLNLGREWLAFFKDKHISFGMEFDKLNPDSVRHFFSMEEKTSWTENVFKSYLAQNKESIDSIEGIWSFGIYEVGIIKDIKPNQFIGFILKADSIRWMPQQIKFKLIKKDSQYQTMFFNGGDHSEQHPILLKNGDTLNFGIFGKWIKSPKTKQKTLQPITVNNSAPSFSILDQKTSLIKLPSFNSKYKTQIDSLILKNKHQIDRTEHLILDVRDNSGGSTKCFEKLLPYLYTNPIKVDGGIVLATEDNIRDCYEIDYPNISKQSKIEMKNDVKKLRAHLEEHYLLYKEYRIKFSKVLKNPSRVSIIINENTASSAELFILRAEQSKKVVLYGSNTSGAVDYGETVLIKLPCNFYSLSYPASKSLHSVKRPLDNVGITPNVKIPSDTTNWVEFVRTYFFK